MAYELVFQVQHVGTQLKGNCQTLTSKMGKETRNAMFGNAIDTISILYFTYSLRHATQI